MEIPYHQWGLHHTNSLHLKTNVFVDNSDLNNYNFEPDDYFMEIFSYERTIHSKLKEIVDKKGKVFKYTL